MTNELQAIELTVLATVTGGEAGPNQTKVNGNLEVSTPGVTVKGQGSYEASRTNYGACLDAMKGQTPQAIKETCGMPGTGQSQ